MEATIYLRGHSLDPAHASRLIGIKPTRSQVTGGFKPGSKKYIAKIGMWALQAKSESGPVSDLVEELIQRIDNRPIRLDQIEGVEDAHLDIFVAMDDTRESETLEFAVTKTQINKLSQLGLSVSVTI